MKNRKVCLIYILIIVILFLVNFNVYAKSDNINNKASVKINYEYKENTNTVLATIISNTELKPTKVSWKLSEDKKQYTFEFNSNTKYTTTVTDINGNVSEVLIDITQIKEKSVEIKYEYKASTNTVLATIISKTELRPTKVSWKLSEDKKQYTFEFNSNTKYTTTVTDINGNVSEVLIDITQIKEKSVEIKYEYKASTNTVLATIISKTELRPTKVSWKLSSDKKQYTFEFNSNTKYTTTVTDINGNVSEVLIDITQIKEKSVEIKYEYKASTNTVLATIISKTELRPTKVSWKLSEDKKQYTFEFNSNTKYTTTVTDINGNVSEVLVEITRN